MKKILYLTSVLFITCISILTDGNFCEANHIDSLILQDLKGVMVRIGISEDVADQFKIESEKLKKRIEERLGQSNIIVYKKDTSDYYMSGRPTIWVELQLLNCGNSDSLDFLVKTGKFFNFAIMTKCARNVI